MERFGKRALLRPETSAIWPMDRDLEFWKKHVDAWFEFTSKKSGVWNNSSGATPNWNISVPEACGGFRMGLELTAFKHVGIFPEQASNWAFITDQLAGKAGDSGDGSADMAVLDGGVSNGSTSNGGSSNGGVSNGGTSNGGAANDGRAKVLNLFAYTGGASLAAAAAGADVTHVDSIKQVISWTRSNMESSKLEGIRWVIEDALKFMQREARRGNRYTGIIMDPPTWGLGAKGEKWRLEDQINVLFETAASLLEEEHFAVISTYSGLTATMVEQLARHHFPASKAEARELVLASGELGRQNGFLPLGNTLRLNA